MDEKTIKEALRLPIEQIYEGGNSKARNPRIQNMLRMVGFGENIGSGFPKIIAAWKETNWGEHSRSRRRSQGWSLGDTQIARMRKNDSYRCLSPHIICYQKNATHLRHILVPLDNLYYSLTTNLNERAE